MCLVLLSYWFSGSGQLLVGLLCAKDTLIVVNKLTSIFFFFFQAEDGIRDGHVTGVQTCALPIWPRADRLASPRAWVESRPVRGQSVPARPLELRGRGLLAASRRSPAKAQRSPARLVPDRRSEERRVGKECRSRGSR